jgi:hypothetical protein
MYLFYDVTLIFDVVIWWWGMKYARELRFQLKILDYYPVSIKHNSIRLYCTGRIKTPVFSLVILLHSTTGYQK